MVMVMAAQDVNIGNTTEVHTSEWLIKMINLMFCIFYHNKNYWKEKLRKNKKQWLGILLR